MITIVEAGDWGQDGHCISALYAVEHNLLSDEELRHAHDAGTVKLGFNFEQEVADEHSYVERKHVERMLECGIRLEDILDLEHPDGDVFYFHKGGEGYAKLWCCVAWLGRPDLRWSVRNLANDALCIGGYGMFYQ